MHLKRLSDALGFVVAGGALITAVLVVAAAGQVTRTILTVSSDPLRDVQIMPPAATPTTGVAGMFARGERTNILLLGYGGTGHDGAYLTDSLMVASIDPRSGVVTLLSIPRDLWVTFPKSKYAGSYSAKVNEAFAIAASEGDRDEGMRLAALTLEPVLGITLHRAIVVDFRAFRTVVDAIGGIDVDVDKDFTALYPRNDDPAVDPSWIEITFKSGTQHMDGETALRYARARYVDGPEGSDFARSVRQQKVILAAKERVGGADAVQQLLPLMEALRENVRTDLSLADMKTLAEFARSYDVSRTVRAALTSGNVLQDGLSATTGYALWPRVEGWGGVHAFVRRTFEYPASLAEDPEVVVSASAGRAFAARNAVRRLQELGLRVRLEVAAGSDPEGTLIASRPEADATARFLLAYFAGAASDDAATLVVVRLGRDWRPPLEFQAPFEDPARPPQIGASPAMTPTPTPAARAPEAGRP